MTEASALSKNDKFSVIVYGLLHACHRTPATMRPHIKSWLPSGEGSQLYYAVRLPRFSPYFASLA